MSYTPRQVSDAEVHRAVAGRKDRRRAAKIVRWLIQEQELIGNARSPERPTYGEAELLSQGIAAAKQIRNDGAARLGGLIQQAQQLRGEIALAEGDMARLSEQPVSGTHADLLTATEATNRHDTIATRVRKEADAGSLKHRLVPTWLRRAILCVPVVDLPILTLFSGDIFNVAWDQVAAGQSLLPAITSLIFDLLGTAVIALGLHTAGFDLRGAKDDQAEPQVPKGQAGVVHKVLIGSAAAISVGASVVMGYRVVRESLAAEVGMAGAVILGLFFACVVATLNLMVVITVFRDGSVQTDELRHLSKPLRRIRLQHLALQRQRDELIGQLDLLIVEGQQVKQQTILQLAEPVVGAEQLRAITRGLHQACGWGVDLLAADSDSFGVFAPGIDVDTRILDELLQQLEATAVPREAVLPDAAEAGEGPRANKPHPVPSSTERALANGQVPTTQDDSAA
ncbi:hypothetical protein [Nocardia mexicana]|uniref:hypothetical protein n=1 Tax=Nocardia mexicana TaxID=279262 RepID=UPI00082CF281|nr:hypothetical protein [Nocardia mexicana]